MESKNKKNHDLGFLVITNSIEDKPIFASILSLTRKHPIHSKELDIITKIDKEIERIESEIERNKKAIEERFEMNEASSYLLSEEIEEYEKQISIFNEMKETFSNAPKDKYPKILVIPNYYKDNKLSECLNSFAETIENNKCKEFIKNYKENNDIKDIVVQFVGHGNPKSVGNIPIDKVVDLIVNISKQLKYNFQNLENLRFKFITCNINKYLDFNKIKQELQKIPELEKLKIQIKASDFIIFPDPTNKNGRKSVLPGRYHYTKKQREEKMMKKNF